MHNQITWLGAVSEGDAERWERLGVPGSSIIVTGDTRHDQVLEQISDISKIGSLLRWKGSRNVLVAGSTDPRDERVILKSFARVSESNPSAGLLLVPHDPSKKRVGQVVTAAKREGVETEIWDGGEISSDTRCVVVRALGMLADLYVVGELAYVGGGFTAKGLHTVLEPAALGVPIIVGPRWRESGDASIVLKAGGGIALPPSAPENRLASVWSQWLSDVCGRTAVGMRARACLHQGAARKTASELTRIMS